jgi:hypothetical protein
MLLSPVIRRFLPKKDVQQQDVDMALLSGYKVNEDRTGLSFLIGSVLIKFRITVDSLLASTVSEIQVILKGMPRLQTFASQKQKKI